MNTNSTLRLQSCTVPHTFVWLVLFAGTTWKSSRVLSKSNNNGQRKQSLPFLGLQCVCDLLAIFKTISKTKVSFFGVIYVIIASYQSIDIVNERVGTCLSPRLCIQYYTILLLLHCRYRQYLAPSLHQVVKALDDIEDKDYEWRAQLMM